MWLREELREEELHELGVALQPVVAVELLPALVGFAPLIEGQQSLCPRTLGAERHGGADEDDPLDALRVLGSKHQRSLRAHRVSDDEGAPGLSRVQDRERVGGELRLGVRLGLLRAVGAAVPARVEGQHAAVAREVRDLRLPAARVDERPGRQQQDRRLALSV